MQYRPNITKSEEIKQILMADAALTIAFSIALAGGIFGNLMAAIALLPMAFVAVTLSFVLHEMMHKYTAQHYGAIAAFQTSKMGLLITLGTSIFGFLFGIPGATVIYTNSFTAKQNGITSLAGPLTNFAVFAVFFVLFLFAPPLSYINYLAAFVMFISILLAFFNMLPIMPLDGAKVLRWSKNVYFSAMGVIVALMGVAYYSLFKNVHGMIMEIVFMLFIAIFFSMFYRNVL